MALEKPKTERPPRPDLPTTAPVQTAPKKEPPGFFRGARVSKK